MKKPTEAQKKVLRNLKANRDPFGHLTTASEHGGASGTIRAMVKLGWITWELKLTEAGKQLLEVLE